MESKWLTRGAFAALIMGVLGSPVGCAAERDPINRVQAGVVPKTFFLGPNLQDFRDDPEFRTKSFNIDSAANTDNYSGTVGGASAVERVRWEVTEKFLFARRSYQETPGADNRGLPRREVSPGKFEFPTPPTGTIVAAYPIVSHFDIRRGYNPSTGEEQNTIEENTIDRPWQQREYMRVDWSQNLAQSTSGDTSWVFGPNAKLTALEYNASNEADSEDRPHFELTDGYFDITNKYSITPEVIPSFGVPECVIVGFFNGTTSFDCSPTEVRVRHSFVKLTGKEDFEPFEESMAPRDIVGNWGSAGNSFNREYGGPPITAWDPQYGFTDATTKTFYSIHNIWEKSHQDVTCASNEDADNDGTADACAVDITQYAGSSGSQCDVHIGKCTIPVRDRKVKTVAYWLNADAPQELADEVSEDGKTVIRRGAYEELTDTWNQIFKVSVATRREVECRRTHDGSRDECHSLYFTGTGPESKQMVKFGGWGIDTPTTLDVDLTDGNETPIIATCHNPVRAYDPKVCGKPGEVIRLGDVRKNYAIYWPYASRAPYGGVASIGGDPLTGEMVGVTATTMMRSATYAAAQQRDIIALALGDLQMDELIEGVQASRYADLVKNGKVSQEMNHSKTPSEISAAVANLDLPSIQAAIGENPALLRNMTHEALQLRAASLRAMSSPQTASIAQANERLEALSALLDRLPETREVQNRNLKRLVAESSARNTPVYDAIKTMSSRDPSRIQEMFDHYQSYLGSRGVCFHDSINMAGAGSIYLPTLAPYFKRLYGSLDPKSRGAKIYHDLLRESTKGIAFHEIGHSLGLRHNFASSWDALNYLPQYWQLRTNEGQSIAECTEAGKACMGPRYKDPMTDDEAGLGPEPRPGIEYFANTSTMEYQIERGGETVGAGTYDLHAMKTLYGRVLETFDSKQVKPEEQQYFALTMLSQGISSDLIYIPSVGYGAHYTKAAVRANVFDPKRDCRDATEEEKETAKWRIVHGKVCSQSPKNHLSYDDMKSSEISFKLQGQVIPIGVDGVRWKGKDENGKELVRWQYRYGEDYSRGGYVHAKPFDAGADIYETTLNVINRYKNQYPWTYFRRQNKEFAWWSLPSGVANSTFARLRGYHWSTTTDIGRSDAAGLKSDDAELPSVMAAKEMFDFLQQVILTPEPGTYGLGANSQLRTAPNGTPILDLLTDSELGRTTTFPSGTLGIIDGRFIQVDFDNSLGGSWDYNAYPKHSGFDEEKVLALRELVDSRPTLSTVSRENALDGRDPYISFRTDTPHAVDRLLGGILSEDWETISPSLNADGKTHTVFSLVDRDPSKLVRPADNKGIIFPNIGYSNELGAAIYAMLFSRFSTDMVLAQKMRVRYDGDDVPTFPADRQIGFTDPTTGIRYIAVRYGTEQIAGRAVEKGIASRMLQHANDLLSRTYQIESTTPGGEHQVKLVDGLPVLKAGAEANEIALRRYIGLLDAMRQVGNILGGGPLGSGGGDE
ncbi:MAG TPA: zinc-dependent metalloprotease [Labilithrix sp.]|nr:zinc-dependent metalloprotease [Labilithrix sp.]